jgi:ABC-type phosphate/phosphonate transport system substrate-binding protein
MKCFALLLAVLPLCGCGTFPRDPDKTLSRVSSERTFRVGLIADGQAAQLAPEAAAFLQRVSAATGAKPALRKGASEPLLLDLKAGKLDLVLGTVSPDSPWALDVAILPPLAERTAPQHLIVSPIARNGENRWIMLLEREDDAVSAATAAKTI